MSDASSVTERERYWRNTVEKMRERLKNRADAAMFEGIREDKLYHGLKLTSSTLMIGTLSEICYCTETQEYLVLDAGVTIHRYSMQGKPIRPSYPLSATMLFTRMKWCTEASVWACYIPHDDLIWIVSVSCKLLQVVRNEFRIDELFYCSTTNEIIVVGANKLTRYPMHDTEHPLNSLPSLSYMDSAFGAIWKIECSSLVEVSSKTMFSNSSR